MPEETRPKLQVTIESFRSTKLGNFVLRTFALVCVLIVIGPSLVTAYFGVKTEWFERSLDPNGSAFALVSFMESYIRSPNDVLATLLTAFPPISFCLAYAGRKNATLTRFGAALLLVLLGGVIAGIGFGTYLSDGSRQLPCTDPDVCISWLSARCSESGRQSLTYLLLIMGFDKMTSR